MIQDHSPELQSYLCTLRYCQTWGRALPLISPSQAVETSLYFRAWLRSWNIQDLDRVFWDMAPNKLTNKNLNFLNKKKQSISLFLIREMLIYFPPSCFYSSISTSKKILFFSTSSPKAYINSKTTFVDRIYLLREIRVFACFLLDKRNKKKIVTSVASAIVMH